MCDCCWLLCEKCDRGLPVHIGDFCTPRETIVVRCKKHRPTEGDGWVKFVGCRGEKKYGDWYMAYIGEDDLGEYGIGEEGNIVPNCDFNHEEDYQCKT